MRTQHHDGRFSLWIGVVALAVILLLPSVTFAQEPEWRTALAEDGLAAAEEVLEADAAEPEAAFLLGGVRFLRAVESVLQTRYATYTSELEFVPGMSTELPPNPNGRFDPAFVETAMTGALAHLRGAETALAVAVQGDFAAEVHFDDIWFDVDADGERSDWEGLLGLTGAAIGTPGKGFQGVVRFDSADADWLKAYVHLTSGLAELTLSVDPTPAIRAVTEGRAALEEYGELNDMGLPGEDFLETAASVLVALRGSPDADRTRAALGHFRAMVAHNRDFWTKVEQETDNEREWLPNARQQAAFGPTIDGGVAESWRDVLDEIDALLEGEKLIPYWRVTQPGSKGNNVGINLARVLEEPGDMDLVLWIQGAAAAPYLERGELVDLDAWSRFEQGVSGGGESFIFALWLN